MINFYLEGQSPLDSESILKISKAINEVLKNDKELSLGLSFVDSNTIQELNEKYAGNNYPTDVLSFDYKDDKEASGDGDIVICTEIAKSQSEDNNISFESELTLLVVHGALHILGYDHQNAKEVASLDALQGDIMKKLNYKYRDFLWSH
jgi:probable rRNA maturation factor